MAKFVKVEQKLPKHGRVTPQQLAETAERFDHSGRGAISNPTGRYEPDARESFDDGWDTVEEAPPPLRTELTAETARTIITFNQSPDIRFDRSINPYRGCEHGCVYCFARPSHAYQGLSPGLDFESKLFFKPNGPALLRRELSKPRYVPRVIALGINTDAYQPIEKRLRLTRAFLEILAEFRHPVSLLTKSALIQRDIDILAPLAEMDLTRVGISLTTLDPKLARRMEPRAASPRRRLETIEKLSAAGIPVTVMTAPLIPSLNDNELESLLEAAANAGATGAGYVLLRLPYELKDLFHEWLAEHYPDRAARVVNLLREMRGGKDYDARWFERGSGKGPYARLIAQRFATARRRLGLDMVRPPLRMDLFRVRETPDGQMSLDV
ncbi:MAG: PA0069 family radical SAM protein [Hyphomonadaceae bacterium]|nr:PA0069 family radical SAM protein [Hyphomonadaceae bacterium]